jgi:DNA-binding NtrC family response regulator
MLVRYFLQRHSEELGTDISGIGASALELLHSQPWPGNVRELENVVCQAMLLARGPTLERENVAEAMERINRSATSQAPFLSGWLAGKVEAAQRGELQDVHAAVLGVVERELLAQAMQLAGGNLAKAARWLGVSRLTLRQKLQAFGLRPPPPSAR